MGALTISTFFIGLCTAFFTIFAVHILHFRKERTRFQTIIGLIMAMWAVWSLKDIVIMFPGMYRQDVLNWISIVDGWSAISYMVLVFESTQPGWTTLRKLMLVALPFALFTVIYALWPDQRVFYAYTVFLWCFAWSIIFMAVSRVRRYRRYEHDNFSNIENIDVSWFKYVMYFAIVSQLSWLLTAFMKNSWMDIVYYLSTIIMWLMVLYYTWDFQPITIEMDEKTKLPVKGFAFAGQLEQIVEEQRLYLKHDLTINDLAHAVESNRTYVSSYISQVMGLTFYDYINRLRIERQSIPMMQDHPEFTLEYVANESGFSSISTFRRAFVKITGKTPSQFSQK